MICEEVAIRMLLERCFCDIKTLEITQRKASGMKIITRENVPCWYELSWNRQCRAVTLRVHREFADSIKEIPQTSPMVDSMKKQFGFKIFGGSLRGTFGFDEAFTYVGESEDFLIHRIFTPTVRFPSRKKCNRCRGSGRDPDRWKKKCLMCQGCGREYEYSNEDRAISASFTLFSMLARGPEIETSCSLPQLLTFKTITIQDRHGGSISGEFSIPLCKWLVGFPERASVSLVQKAMICAYDRMYGLTNYDRCNFKASMLSGPGRLFMDCPGNACGIHPDSSHFRGEEDGYDFTCHNVDSSLQQFTLIAGLAALHDLARKQIKSY